MDKITNANKTFNSDEINEINEIKETSIWIRLVYSNWLNDNEFRRSVSKL